MTRSGTFLPSAAIIISAALWGSIWIPVHVVRDFGLPGTWVAFLIYGFPALLLAPWSLRSGVGPFFKNWRILAILGLFTGICNVLYAIGIAYGDVAMVLLLFYVNPVWSAIFERIALKSKISRWRKAAIGLGLAGMWVLIGGSGTLAVPIGSIEWVGLFAGISWAAALVVMRVAGHVDNMDKAFSQYAFGFVIGGIIIVLGIFPGEVDWTAISWPLALLWAAATGCIWVLPGMLFCFWGAARVSPTRTSMLFMTEVVVGVGSAALLGESEIGWRHVIGGSMIIAAGIFDGLTDKHEEVRVPA